MLPSDPPPHIEEAYRLSPTGRTTARLVGMGVVVALLGLPVVAWATNQDWDTVPLALMVAVLLGYVAWRITLEFATGYYTLTANSLVYNSQHTHKETYLTDIEGYRVLRGDLRIYSVYVDEPYIPLSISATGDLARIREWFVAHYPNLDMAGAAASAPLSANAAATTPAGVAAAASLALANVTALAAPGFVEQKFYLPTPSWFGRHVGPWLLYLPVSGVLGYLWLHEPHSLPAHLCFLLVELVLLLLLVAVLTDTSVTCFTVGQQQVTLEEAGRVKQLLFSEVKGFGEHTYRGSTYTLIEPLDATWPTIRLDNSFVEYARLREVLARHMPDLDAAERERHSRALAATTELLLQAPALGPTPQARQAALARATRVVWLNLAAFPLALWALFYAFPYELVMALNLAVPLLAVGALWWYKDAVRFVAPADDPRLSLVLAMALPSLAMALRNALDFSFVSWATIWPAALAAAFAFLLFVFLGNWSGFRQAKSPAAVGATALAVALAYGFSAAVVYNCASGGTLTTQHPAQVAGQYRYGSRSSNYYLDLTPGAPARVKVRREFYEQKKVGDTVTVRRHQGRLGADWFGVAGAE